MIFKIKKMDIDELKKYKIEVYSNFIFLFIFYLFIIFIIGIGIEKEFHIILMLCLVLSCLYFSKEIPLTENFALFLMKKKMIKIQEMRLKRKKGS